ncbi:MAG: hypothetical protein PHD57_13285 [Desulfobacterales bacterium]|nr:hypothetical protein [Desulfobacterales bacterium]
MQMPITAEDILVGMFYYLKESDHEKVTADRERLHQAFYKIKKDHPNLMAMFSFRERELFPESTQLDQALSNLDATGLISRQNFVPRYYRFESPLTSSYKKFSKNILHSAGINDQEIRAAAQEIKCLMDQNL